jgi:hypothetical protein
MIWVSVDVLFLHKGDFGSTSSSDSFRVQKLADNENGWADLSYLNRIGVITILK